MVTLHCYLLTAEESVLLFQPCSHRLKIQPKCFLLDFTLNNPKRLRSKLATLLKINNYDPSKNLITEFNLKSYLYRAIDNVTLKQAADFNLAVICMTD